MMRKIVTASLFILLAPLTQAANVTNEYVFVENNIDGEFFISPMKLDPRFTGANMFTKYSNNSQLSMGYMGAGNLIYTGSYADIWIENSPIERPFIGNRCMRNASRCPDSGYIPGDYVANNGIYHIPVEHWNGESGYPRGVFSDSAYQYFKQVNVGSTEVYQYKQCWTREKYDPAAGETCATSKGTVYTDNFTITKAGHIRLVSTNSLQEIFIDSNGNPVIGMGSDFCKIGYIGNDSGALCKMVAYSMQGTMFDSMYTHFSVDTKALGFTPAGNLIRVSRDGVNDWYNYNAQVQTKNIISPGEGGIYVFFSNTFFKQVIDRGTDLTKSQNMFTFGFRNTRVPQSGFYEFSPSNTLIIRARDYGISILSKDLTLNPKREGKIGDNEPPIRFDYIVTTSGPRQADNITAQVSGPVGSINGNPYCIFSSSDGKTQVPFSAYLSWTEQDGNKQRVRASCDDQPISLNQAHWTKIPWPDPLQNDGDFYRTDLGLSFPMNEAASRYSLDGRDWIGVVGATGEVKVTATWTGVDNK